MAEDREYLALFDWKGKSRRLSLPRNIQVERLWLNPLTVDPPNLRYGDLWYRRDLNEWRAYTPVGIVKVGPGISKLSELEIDVSKDWGGYVIKNLGAPVDPNDAIRKADLDAHEGKISGIHGVGTSYIAKTAYTDHIMRHAEHPDIGPDDHHSSISYLLDIEPATVKLESKTVDPALASGLLWFRSDLARLKWSPDGVAIEDLCHVSELDSHKATTPIDHPDRSVTRTKLEYPTVDVSFSYLASINKLVICSMGTYGVASLVRDTFADKAVFGGVQVNDWPAIVGRLQGYFDLYYNYYYPGATTADHGLRKLVGGAVTVLGTEAIDIDYKGRGLMIRCSGTTIESMRFELLSVVDPLALPAADYTISVTDTSFASGYFGYRNLHEVANYGGTTPDCVWLKSASSPEPGSASASVRLPKTLGYYEVPIIGDGSEENPFRAQMPYEEYIDPVLGKRNLQALSHSSLIPTDPTTGKPIHGTALVRIFEQPDRDATLHPIASCLDALRAMPGVRELTRGEALRLAREMDDKLHLCDLEPKEGKGREYVDWRIRVLGVKPELIDEKRVIEYAEREQKGW